MSKFPLVCMQIKVEFTQGSPFNFDLCPDHCVEEDTTAADSSQQAADATATTAQPQEQQAQDGTTEAAADPAQTHPGGATVQNAQETSPAGEQAATAAAGAVAEAEALPGALVEAAVEQTAAAAAAAGQEGEGGNAAGNAGEHARQDHKRKPPLEVMRPKLALVFEGLGFGVCVWGLG